MYILGMTWVDVKLESTTIVHVHIRYDMGRKRSKTNMKKTYDGNTLKSIPLIYFCRLLGLKLFLHRCHVLEHS